MICIKFSCGLRSTGTRPWLKLTMLSEHVSTHAYRKEKVVQLCDHTIINIRKIKFSSIKHQVSFHGMIAKFWLPVYQWERLCFLSSEWCFNIFFNDCSLTEWRAHDSWGNGDINVWDWPTILYFLFENSITSTKNMIVHRILMVWLVCLLTCSVSAWSNDIYQISCYCSCSHMQ